MCNYCDSEDVLVIQTNKDFITNKKTLNSECLDCGKEWVDEVL